MSLKNKFDNVIIRNNNSIGVNDYGLDYLLRLEKENQELKKELEESDFKIANLTMDKIELNKQLETIRLDQTKKYLKH